VRSRVNGDLVAIHFTDERTTGAVSAAFAARRACATLLVGLRLSSVLPPVNQQSGARTPRGKGGADGARRPLAPVQAASATSQSNPAAHRRGIGGGDGA
jgi:hypothetical protein